MTRLETRVFLLSFSIVWIVGFLFVGCGDEAHGDGECQEPHIAVVDTASEFVIADTFAPHDDTETGADPGLRFAPCDATPRTRSTPVE